MFLFFELKGTFSMIMPRHQTCNSDIKRYETERKQKLACDKKTDIDRKLSTTVMRRYYAEKVTGFGKWQ
jgi:hypothetical protein